MLEVFLLAENHFITFEALSRSGDFISVLQVRQLWEQNSTRVYLHSKLKQVKYKVEKWKKQQKEEAIASAGLVQV